LTISTVLVAVLVAALVAALVTKMNTLLYRTGAISRRAIQTFISGDRRVLYYNFAGALHDTNKPESGSNTFYGE
jgi:hypothetical protein